MVFLKETVRASDIVGKHKHSRITALEDTCSLRLLLWFENIFSDISKWLHRSPPCEKHPVPMETYLLTKIKIKSNPLVKKSDCSLFVPVERKSTIYSTDPSYFMLYDNLLFVMTICRACCLMTWLGWSSQCRSLQLPDWKLISAAHSPASCWFTG